MCCQVRHAVRILISQVLEGLGIVREQLIGNTLVSAKLTVRASPITHPLSNRTALTFRIYAQSRGLSQDSTGQSRLDGAQKNIQLSQTPGAKSLCDFLPPLPPPPHWARFHHRLPDSLPTDTWFQALPQKSAAPPPAQGLIFMISFTYYEIVSNLPVKGPLLDFHNPSSSTFFLPDQPPRSPTPRLTSTFFSNLHRPPGIPSEHPLCHLFTMRLPYLQYPLSLCWFPLEGPQTPNLAFEEHLLHFKVFCCLLFPAKL